MLFDLLVRGLTVLIFISGSTMISYYITRFLAFLIPSVLISEIFLWSGTVILATLLLMSVAYFYVYRGFGAQADIIRRMPSAGNKVAITFDDGPSAEYTPLILKILADKGVKAAFFMVGQQVEKCPDLAMQIAEEDHCLGNHTYGHITVPNTPPPQLTSQIMRTNLLILRYTGVYPQYLRPPRGLYDMRMRRIAKLLGQEMILWSLSSQDWHPRATVAGVIRRVIDKAAAGDIILFHDSGSLLGGRGADRSTTVFALGPIIDGLRARGLEIVGLDELISDPSVTCRRRPGWSIFPEG